MSANREEKFVGNEIKTIAEIGGYVTTLLPYLLALLGKSSLPYPTLISTLTLAFSVLVLWRWRWGAITKTKTKKPVRVTLTDTWRAADKDPLAMPMARRRFEILLLSLFALGTLGLTGANLPAIREELSGFRCLSDSRAFRVIITNFSSESTFEDDMAGVMYGQARKQFQICRYREQVNFPDLAQVIGEQKKADLVVWGIKGSDRVTVYLTAIDWELLNERHGGVSVGQGAEQAAFLANVISAEILFNRGEVAAAQNSLYDALDAAEIQDWVQIEPELLAEGYLELGLLFDPINTSPKDADAGRAIESYSQAIDIVEQHGLDLNGPYLNRALLYYGERRYDWALEDYAVLIEKGSQQANSAHVMRAQIFLDTDRCSSAIEELDPVHKAPHIEEDPLFGDITHYLGYSYLVCGDYERAEQTFQSLSSIGSEDANLLMMDLEVLTGETQDPAAKEAIERIMEYIQQLPSN